MQKNAKLNSNGGLDLTVEVVREYESSLHLDEEMAINEYVQKGSGGAGAPKSVEEEEKQADQNNKKAKKENKEGDEDESDKDSGIGSDAVKEEETFDFGENS